MKFTYITITKAFRIPSIMLVAIGVLLLPLVAGASLADDNVVISEIEYDPTGAENEAEWIELFNPTASSIDVSGWTLEEGGGPSYTIPSSTLIPAEGYLLLVNNPADFTAAYPTASYDLDMTGVDCYRATECLRLNNTGDQLTLRDGSVGTGATVDFVAWEGYVAGWAAPSAGPGESACRTTGADTDTSADWTNCISPDPGEGSYDLIDPDVTLEQDSAQDDPTAIDSATFVVTFSEPIDEATWVSGDITLAGTTGIVTVGPTEISPMDDTTYQFTVSGITDGDIVIASIDAGMVDDPAGNSNSTSSSSDNSVTYDITAPGIPLVTALSTEINSPALSGTLSAPTNASDEVIITIDGNKYTAVNNADGTWSLVGGSIMPVLSVGSYSVDISATDTAGNIANNTATNVLQILAPEEEADTADMEEDEEAEQEDTLEEEDLEVERNNGKIVISTGAVFQPFRKRKGFRYEVVTVNNTEVIVTTNSKWVKLFDTSGVLLDAVRINKNRTRNNKKNLALKVVQLYPNSSYQNIIVASRYNAAAKSSAFTKGRVSTIRLTSDLELTKAYTDRTHLLGKWPRIRIKTDGATFKVFFDKNTPTQSVGEWKVTKKSKLKRSRWDTN